MPSRTEGGTQVPAASMDEAKREAGRRELLLAVQKQTRVPMILLAALMLVLVTLHLAVPLPPESNRTLKLAEWLIWQVFLAEFLLTFFLAPQKLRFLRENWLMAIALAFPVLRVFHIFYVIPALPGQPTFQVIAVTSRGLHKLAVLLAGRRLLFLSLCVVVAVLSSAAGEFAVEHRAPGTTIRSYGDAVWWAAGTVTSVGTELYPVTAEGRVIAIVTMVFGVAVVGYLAAAVAALFVGVDASARNAKNGGEPAEAPTDLEGLREELRALEARIDQLSELLRTAVNRRP